ncbi:MAG: hypothetical protein CL666_01490 [Balneola sp.]|nr:hypothetical protein [Balneola sp.]|tara:strand:- start:87678 stop:88034 length:357 start_codon:yes stop_codon:yes gene_type:complete
MEINKLSNHINGQVNNTKGTESAEGAQKASAVENKNSNADKVSLSGSSASKSEELFAKIELEKLNHSSFEKLKGMKAKIDAYQSAKADSPEAANKTEIGQMLNDPEMWGKIAQNIIDK